MQFVILTLVSLLSYIGGLIIISKITPKLLASSYDEGLFMGMAAVDIIGAIMAFGGVAVIYIIYNANLGVKIVSFFLLAGIVIVAVRTALSSFRPRMSHTVRASRIIAGGYGLCLAAAALFYIVQLFISR
jgi:hypothetical protein